MPVLRAPAVDTEAVDRFAVALEQFASTLTPREYSILRALVEETLPPLEKMRRRSPDEILTAPERAILDRLKGGDRQGQPRPQRDNARVSRTDCQGDTTL